MKIPKIIDNSPFRVLGIYGEFAVAPSKWKVCHFSTYASSKKASKAGNTASLLRELKPMRERVRPRDINDMSALLQRDLNDARVANELVPYLTRNSAAIGFFPAVLCALLPTGFLETQEGSDDENPYPEPVATEGWMADFGSCWKMKLYQNDLDEPSALGELWIDPSRTDIVVLDGQHRANAFRFVTDTFPEATKPESIYHAFYKGAETKQDFEAELPVTIVWFQQVSDEKVNPKIISRRLFVDVNTNAKTVNKARNILLDDKTPSSIFTNIFYTELAKYSFCADKLSLLHGAFDIEDDQNSSAIALFSPVAIEYALRLFILGKDECDDLGYTVQRDRSKDHLNVNRIARFIDVLSGELQQQIDLTTILSSLHDQIVRIGVAQSAIKYAYRLLSEFNLFRAQIDASSALENAVASGGWGNTTRKLVWERVYCGGEGLYSSLRSPANNDEVSPYVSGINEVEEKFKVLRLERVAPKAGQLQLIKDTYAVASSLAGVTGLFMALSKCSEKTGWEYEKNGKEIACVDNFVELLNKTPTENWLVILTELKKGVAGGLEPKSWTHLRNIYLRVIENNSSGEYQFFSGNMKWSPDVRFVVADFDAAMKGLKAIEGQNYVASQEVVNELRQQSLRKLRKCLERCNLNYILPEDYEWPKYMLYGAATSNGEKAENNDEASEGDVDEQDHI